MFLNSLTMALSTHNISQMLTSSLSSRGKSYQRVPPRSLAVTNAAREDAYDPFSNPNGYINLSVSENATMIDDLHSRVSKVPLPPKDHLLYGPSHGSPDFLEQIAKFYTRHFLPAQAPAANPESFIATCGSGAALDILANVICDPGDRIIVHGPGYGGFARDVCFRAGTELIIAPMDCLSENPRTLVSGAVNLPAFEKTWCDAGGDNSGIKAMVICSPVNPTGQVLSAQLIRDLVKWGRKRGMHIIFDEAYALSVYAEGKQPSTVAKALGGDLGNDVHTVWSFSKDFCWSGARVGIAYSQSRDVIKSLRPSMAYLTGASRHTMWVLTKLLEDVKWVKHFLQENNRRLRALNKNAADFFAQSGISYFPAEAGLFMWIDLRQWMKADTIEEEMHIVDRCAEEKVPIRPSSECFGTVFGFFRVSFAAVDEETFKVGFGRLISTVLSPEQMKRNCKETFHNGA